MTDYLANAAAWLADQLQANASKSITYRRGGSDLSISATRGLSGRQVDTQTGVLSWHDQDWHIPVSVLTLGVPRVGDFIIDGSETFEVLQTDAGDCYSPDNTGKIYRIHTKRIAS